MSRKELFVKDLKTKETIRSTFLVRSKETLIAKNGRPYLALLLGDRTGEIDSRIWEDVEQASSEFEEGDIVAVNGKAHLFQNRMQLTVDHLAKVPPAEVTLNDFLPQGPGNLDEMYASLVEVFRGVRNQWVRELSLRLLTDPEIQRRYKLCPAAKSIHHAFIGGLLSHSLQLIKLVEAIAPLYPNLNKDLLLFGAAFHDFGKIFELSFDDTFSYTDEGKLVGHIVIGVTLMDRKMREIPGFPEEIGWELKHLVLAHHGHLEFGSPKKPHTPEALMVHFLDLMDSRMESIESFMKKESGAGKWTSHHKAFDASYFRSSIDKEGNSH